jgi:hypothetical protein
VKGQTIDGRLALVGFRPDGVIAIDIGDSMIVLCNVVENIKTKPIDRLLLDRFGPWMDFTDVKPADAVREKVARLISASSRHVSVVNPAQIGQSDLERASSMELIDTSYTRQDFDNMLQTANFDTAQELPAAGASFEQDADFMQHCMSQIVPMMQQNGLHVANPAGFCSMLHLQRTGLMPSLSQAAPTPAAPSTPPLFDPNAPASNQPVQAAAPPVAPPPDIPNVASPAQTPPQPVPLVVAATPLTKEHVQPPTAPPAAPVQAPPAGQMPGHQGPEKQQMPATNDTPPASPTPPVPPDTSAAIVDETAVSVPHPSAPPVPVTSNPATAIGKPFKRPQDASKVIGKPAAGATNN